MMKQISHAVACHSIIGLIQYLIAVYTILTTASRSRSSSYRCI
ncbi:hypothetical protein M3J09_011919 [Ascochyta lentis]